MRLRFPKIVSWGTSGELILKLLLGLDETTSDVPSLTIRADRINPSSSIPVAPVAQALEAPQPSVLGHTIASSVVGAGGKYMRHGCDIAGLPFEHPPRQHHAKL